jgi:hypothetical protein
MAIAVLCSEVDLNDSVVIFVSVALLEFKVM